MDQAAILAGALVLDAAFGEPRFLWDRLPHPAVVMGNIIGWADRTLNTGQARRFKGVLAIACLCVMAGVTGSLFSEVGALAEVIVAAILLAQRSLVQHVAAVADALRLSLGDGRRAVAMIVGRDSGNMTESEVARAAIESAAENMSDGVVAPAFWFLVLGLPGLLVYKMVNTADSMIGYRTPRYEAFGWAAARLDDVLNWIPARLTAVLIAVSHLEMKNWPAIRRDAPLHRSPNAGWPEAAMASVLGVALSGPRSYDGSIRDYPFVNSSGRKTIGASEIDMAVRALWRCWAALVLIVFLLALF